MGSFTKYAGNSEYDIDNYKPLPFLYRRDVNKAKKVSDLMPLSPD